MLKLSIVLINHLISVRFVVMVLNLWKMEPHAVKLVQVLSHLPKKPKKLEVRKLPIKRIYFEKFIIIFNLY